jgi:hypothetical protein
MKIYPFPFFVNSLEFKLVVKFSAFFSTVTCLWIRWIDKILLQTHLVNWKTYGIVFLAFFLILFFLPETLSFFLSFLAKPQVINYVNRLKEILPLKNGFTLSLLSYWAIALEPSALELQGGHFDLILVFSSLLRVSLTFAVTFTFFFSSALLREVHESSFLVGQTRVVETIGALAEAAARAGEGGGGSGSGWKVAAGGAAAVLAALERNGEKSKQRAEERVQKGLDLCQQKLDKIHDGTNPPVPSEAPQPSPSGPNTGTKSPVSEGMEEATKPTWSAGMEEHRRAELERLKARGDELRGEIDDTANIAEGFREALRQMGQPQFLTKAAEALRYQDEVESQVYRRDLQDSGNSEHPESTDQTEIPSVIEEFVLFKLFF